MAIELIADYLKETTGLDSCSVGILVVEQAVKNRMTISGSDHYIEYYRLLQNSKEELDLLIDQVMVPETWFFRGAEAFKLLKEYAIKKASKNNNKYIKILSIPCATGEEPYSIAMVLKECRYKPNEYLIDAVDIANESLRLARNALFTEHSFRELSNNKKNNYFRKTNSGYRLCHSFKNLVKFSRKNIFDMNVNNSEKYDIIFCRNLLIYFDKETQRKAINKIDTLMSEDGILFIGHGEAGCIAGSGFQKIDRPNAFAFTKIQGPKYHSKREINIYKNNRVTNCTNFPHLKTAKIEQECDEIINAPLINRAIKLADEGNLNQAIDTCKRAIQISGISADVLCLLGVIHDAKGDREEAANYYRRAVHLMPSHYKSLMHLASHADRDGNKLLATEYRIRAKELS